MEKTHLSSIIKILDELQDLFISSYMVMDPNQKITFRNMPITISEEKNFQKLISDIYSFCKARIKTFLQIEPESLSLLLKLFSLLTRDYNGKK